MSGADPAAPVAVAFTHVHSLRIASGAEALAARVLLADGTAGFGFTLNDDAGMARDMAAWDALGRSKGVPLHALLGGAHRKTVRIEKDEGRAISPGPAAHRVDPFALGSVGRVLEIAATFDPGIALLAPHAHPWEIQYCAALAAALKGAEVRIVVRSDAPPEIPVSGEPGIAIDWAAEPAFGRIRWQGP